MHINNSCGLLRQNTLIKKYLISFPEWPLLRNACRTYRVKSASIGLSITFIKGDHLTKVNNPVLFG